MTRVPQPASAAHSTVRPHARRAWRRAGFLTAALALAAAFSVVTPAGAQAAAERPAACGNFAARTAYVTTPSGNAGLVQVSYSSCTRNVWAYLLSYTPPCQPGIDFCGGATIHRNSDGAERDCALPAGGTSCNSAQLYDANVTSYAYGEIDDGPWNATGQTGNW